MLFLRRSVFKFLSAVTIIILLLCMILILVEDYFNLFDNNKYGDGSIQQQEQQQKQLQTKKKKRNDVDTNTNTTATTKTRTQKIVILPGPHKTGSTTVQSALYDWLKTTKTTKTTTTTNPFKDWEWPLPPSDDYGYDGNGKVDKNNGGKSFSYLARALAGYPNGKIDIKSLLEAEKNNGGKINNDNFIQQYQLAFQKAFDSNKNIVIAAEYFDIIAAEQTTKYTDESQQFLNITVGIELLDRLYNILPRTKSSSTTSTTSSSTRKIQREIIVVIMYRHPRVDHLISLWHEIGGRGNSLSDFIIGKNQQEEDLFTKKSYILNPMELGTNFLKYYYFNNKMNNNKNSNNEDDDDEDIYKVILIDTEGILNINADLPTVIACHVLDVPCIWKKKKKKKINDSSSSNTTETTMIMNIPVCIDYNGLLDDDDDDDNGCRQIVDNDIDNNNNNNSVNNNDITATTTTTTTMKNKRSDTGPRDLTPEMIQNIEQLLNNYDCQYKSIFDNIMNMKNNYNYDDNNNHLQFLYQHHMLNNCYDNGNNNDDDDSSEDDDRLKNLLSSPPPHPEGGSSSVSIVKQPFSDVVQAIRNLVATNSTTT